MIENEVVELYPAEDIELPSRGKFYPPNSPLASGVLSIRYMTAKHEDILTSTNLIAKGIVLDKLIDSLIATPKVKSSDLLIGDLNAAMVAARILGYGKDYPAEFQCERCNRIIEKTIDLTDLKKVNEPADDATGKFELVLPMSKSTITVKLLTRGDELTIEKEAKALSKAMGDDVSYDNTAWLRTIITSVEGNAEKKGIWTFVDNMLVRDSRYIREQYRNFIPDMDFDIEVECECQATSTARLPIGVNFFWPDSRV